MKKYSIFSIIFIALIALFVYMEDNSTTTFSIFGINLSIPNAVWVAIFLGLFYILSILFFVFIHLQNFFYKKNIQKDIEIMINNIKNAVLYKNNIKDVKILKYCNNFVKNIKGLEIEPNPTEKFEFFEDIKKLKNGETIEISKYKLDENNPWFILNVKNRIKNDEKYAKEVLKRFKNEELKREAFCIFAKTAPISEILKYDYPITKDIILAHIKDEDLKKLIEKVKLDKFEEIEIAKAIYATRTPDEELDLTAPLPYANAYLALKYEHIEKAKKIIEEHSLKLFEYLIKLKECGLKVEVDEYLNAIT
ncbi:conserved hypothetical protein [Lebetimonas natsushimae]|uniref:DUF1049 domain-containing protein n=1 Tax=Lebetimonas natsushimae TaxID=1936991 RepID=A0A292YB24_9BACT|nr:hypothetical protein [Lebetimonas natsushimae]GAX86729.1 conserved hypothetical protein [Lebetimonas natsushimae]